MPAYVLIWGSAYPFLYAKMWDGYGGDAPPILYAVGMGLIVGTVNALGVAGLFINLFESYGRITGIEIISNTIQSIAVQVMMKTFTRIYRANLSVPSLKFFFCGSLDVQGPEKKRLFHPDPKRDILLRHDLFLNFYPTSLLGPYLAALLWTALADSDSVARTALPYLVLLINTLADLLADALVIWVQRTRMAPENRHGFHHMWEWLHKPDRRRDGSLREICDPDFARAEDDHTLESDSHDLDPLSDEDGAALELRTQTNTTLAAGLEVWITLTYLVFIFPLACPDKCIGSLTKQGVREINVP